MASELKSTNAQVSDPKRVDEILASYALRGVEIDLKQEGEKWFLVMSFKDQDFDWYEWPLALPRELWLSNELEPKDQDTTDFYEDEWDKIFEEKGEEGFLALLRDLAPYLETPLLVVLVNGEPGRSTTIAWNIQPGGKEVETLEISF